MTRLAALTLDRAVQAVSLSSEARMSAAWNKRRKPALKQFRHLPKIDQDAMILDAAMVLNDIRAELGLPLEKEI